LNADKDKRLSAEEALSHSWFESQLKRHNPSKLKQNDNKKESFILQSNFFCFGKATINNGKNTSNNSKSEKMIPDKKMEISQEERGLTDGEDSPKLKTLLLKKGRRNSPQKKKNDKEEKNG